LDEKLFELQALFDLSKALSSTLNLKEILDTILLTPMGRFLLGKGLVLIEKGQEGSYVVESIKGLPKSLVGRQVQLRLSADEPVQVGAISDALSRAFFESHGIALVVPIQRLNKNLGFICFGNKISGAGFEESELSYLHSLSNIAATAIQNGLTFLQLAEAKRQLEKKYQEQNTLFEIERELSSSLASLESEKVVNLLAYSIMGEMMVQKCLIFLREEDTMAFALNKGFLQENLDDLLADSAFLDLLAALDAPVATRQLNQDDPVFSRCTHHGIELLVPMRSANETKGILALGAKITGSEFKDEDIDFLSTLGSMSMISIENVRLFEEKLRNQKMEEELRIASDIQKRLLPTESPKLDGFDIAAVNISSRQVGGDYYDCIKLSDTQYAFCIADVSGKGAPAALLMANLQAALHALLNTGLDITEVVARINNLIHRNTDYDKFITFFFGVLDLTTREFTCVNAGHNPPYIFHSDRTFQTLNEGGLILGMMANVPYESETVTLQRGDSIVMYTDGVSEAMNAAEEEFEEHRIEETVAAHYDASAQGLLDELIAAVVAFAEGQPQADDITGLIIKVL